MLFFIPYDDDNPSARTPVVTYGIIGVNVLVWLIANVINSPRFGVLPMGTAFEYGFVPGEAAWYMFFTSVFLHGDLLHIVGNMVFLWVAGDNVEDKLGRGVYLFFYLVSGALACLAYSAFTSGPGNIPLVGASGAIAGVLGAYMILFPRARIRIFYLFVFFIGTVGIEARWFLGFWIFENLFNWLALDSTYVTGVAYAAHAGGFAVGVLVAVMLKGRLRRRTPATRTDQLTGFAKVPDRKELHRKILEEQDVRRPGYMYQRMKVRRDTANFFGLEEAIADNVRAGRVDVALDRYEEYLGMRHAKPLPPWAQIEIAAEFFRRGDYEESLKAYRRYLAHHPAGADSAEAKFRLGIILSRHRNEHFRAREYLLQASIEHPNVEIVEFARKELERIGPGLDG